jgi:hypothetical protein
MASEPGGRMQKGASMGGPMKDNKASCRLAGVKVPPGFV